MELLRLKKIFSEIVKNKFVLTILVALLVCSSAIIVSQRTAVLEQAVLNNYTSSNANTQPNLQDASRNISIDFKFRYSKLKNKYENLFQTSSGNDGMRLELSDVNFGAWGIVLPGGEKNNIQVIALGDMPLPNVWHTLNIQIERNNIVVYVDGAVRSKSIIEKTDFPINDIAVGTGLSKSRPFSGEIHNFKLEVEKDTRISRYGLYAVWQLIIVLILVCYAIYRNITFGKFCNYFKDNKYGYTDVLKIILFLTMYVMLYKSFYSNLISYKSLYLELFLLFLLGIRFFWLKIQFNDFLKIMVLATGFLFAKKYYVNVSFISAISDVIFVYSIAGLLKIIVDKIFYSKSVSCLFSLIGCIVYGVITLGAVYMRHLDTKTLMQDELFALFQTNVRESKEFLASFFSTQELIGIAFAIIVSGIIIYMILSRNKKYEHYHFKQIVVLIILSIICSMYAGVGQSIFAPIFVLADGYRKNISQMQYYQALRDKNIIKAQKMGGHKGETYVFVIGESGNKRHYSSYGYFRDTTPWLASFRGSSNAVFLENAYASFVHTVPSLMKALTSANQYNKELDFSAPSIIEVAKAAGFKTYWFSNQNKSSLVDNPLTVLADKADVVSFTPRTGLDEELISLISDKLVDLGENNIIFVHIIGSHADYKTRIPRDYDTNFKESGEEYLGNHARDKDFVNNILNPYDASTKYTDANLRKIYETIYSKVPDLSAFVYMPDHGEDVYGKKFHNASIFTYEMARIPVFTLFSNDYKKKYPEKFNALNANREQVFTSDLLFDLFMGLTDIKSNLYVPKFDLSSPMYSLNWQNAMTMWTDTSLQADLYAKVKERRIADDQEHIKRENISYLKKTSGVENKFLALHTDAVGATIEAIQEGFPGIEINVTAKDGKLMMGHGPEKIYPLSFDDFLSKIPLKNINRIWLDLKIWDAN